MNSSWRVQEQKIEEDIKFPAKKKVLEHRQNVNKSMFGWWNIVLVSTYRIRKSNFDSHPKNALTENPYAKWNLKLILCFICCIINLFTVQFWPFYTFCELNRKRKYPSFPLSSLPVRLAQIVQNNKRKTRWQQMAQEVKKIVFGNDLANWSDLHLYNTKTVKQSLLFSFIFFPLVRLPGNDILPVQKNNAAQVLVSHEEKIEIFFVCCCSSTEFHFVLPNFFAL